MGPAVLSRSSASARYWMLLGCALTVLPAPAQVTSQPSPEREPIARRRIVKHFDFNERPAQNFGTTPVGWRPYRARGFPIFMEGRFDDGAGRASAPSFRLDLNGGSIAYQYEGNDIAVGANSDYLIVAWVKTASLKTARAYFTVCLLDRKGVRIEGTLRQSELVGGADAETEWQPIQVGLQGNVPDARYIGLALWLTQQTIWDDRPRPLRFIEHEDVSGTAWFDDVTVYRLPRVSLRSANPGNVFVEPSPAELLPEVTDPDGLKLTARLTVHAADGTVVDDRPVSVQSADGSRADERFVYPGLPPGLYTATLTVSTHDTALVWRSLRFMQLAGRFNASINAGRGFGVVLDRTDPGSLAGQCELLKELRAEYVKLPIWYAQRAAAGLLSSETDTIDGYLEGIVNAGGDPIGIQMDDPRVDTTAGSGAMRSMLDLLSEDPLAWKPLIAGVWSRYAGLIYVWQLGDDWNGQVSLDHRLPGLLLTLRKEMGELMPKPQIATPISAQIAGGAGSGGDYLAVPLPASVWPEDIERHIGPLLGKDPRRIWVTVEPLAAGPYQRELRLADLSRRLAETLFLNVGAVFLASPWETTEHLLGVQVDPSEEYLVLRTMADVLSEATPVSRMSLSGHARCLVFDRNGQAVLFAWDEYAPPGGREHVIYLGDNAQQLDLWGRRVDMPAVGEQRRVRIGPVPTFIVNTPTWMMEFRRQFVLESSAVEASFEGSQRDIVFRNTYHEPISGVLRLVAPENWDIRPSKLAFALQPGAEFRQAIDMRFPLNAEAGVKLLVGEFAIDANRRFRIVTPAWFELGLERIDLEAYAFRTGDRGIVRVSLTNRTDEPVHFDGDLVVPGRQRMTRLFPNIQPGQSITKDFVLDNVAELIGQRLRVHFAERQGTGVWNRVLQIP